MFQPNRVRAVVGFALGCAVWACGDDGPATSEAADASSTDDTIDEVTDPTGPEQDASTKVDAEAPVTEPSESNVPDDGEDAGACVPQTCDGLGVQCGRASDGCGATLDCGRCPSETDAGGDCIPRTCGELAAECGSIADGCGTTLDCGQCPSGEVCGVTDANRCECEDAILVDSVPQTARRARSLGFAGTEDEYFELYDIPCDDASECVDVCSLRGGADAMCAASECSGFEGETQCLPATVWRDLSNILFEGNSVDDAAELTVVYSPYRDTLLVDDFQLELPDDAAIAGITVELRRAGDATISDYSIKLAMGDEVIGAERAEPDLWTEELEWITYGGPTDTWGYEWTASELLQPDFGVAIAVAYTQMAGNARAYVDQVRVTIHYSNSCTK